MDKPLFYVLLNLILPVLKAKCKCYRNIRLSCDCMLSMILSFLGGTRISDLQILYRPVRKKLIFSYIHNVIDAINETLVFQFPLDIEKLTKIEAGFRANSRKQVLKDCLGAIDGIYFAMLNPSSRVKDVNKYFVQWKNKFALLYLACCDAD